MPVRDLYEWRGGNAGTDVRYDATGHYAMLVRNGPHRPVFGITEIQRGGGNFLSFVPARVLRWYFPTPHPWYKIAPSSRKGRLPDCNVLSLLLSSGSSDLYRALRLWSMSLARCYRRGSERYRSVRSLQNTNLKRVRTQYDSAGKGTNLNGLFESPGPAFLVP
eukprot:1632951-Rhodomonas_salina.2